MTIFLVAWYVFCGLLIFGMIQMFRTLNRPRFRDEVGDITSEVGYEEDSLGNIRYQEGKYGLKPDAAEAHIMVGNNEGTGLLG